MVSPRSCWSAEQSTIKSSKMRASTSRWERILSFRRGERARVTLPLPPSPIFCSVNADKRCCFTVCGGSIPAHDRPIEVVGERGGGRGGGRGKGREGRGERGGGKGKGEEGREKRGKGGEKDERVEEREESHSYQTTCQ